MKSNKIILLVILVMFAVGWTANKTIDLGGDGSQYFKLNYLDNSEGPVLHIEFVAHIDQALGFFKTATAICFNKQDNSSDVQAGDPGFGLMFACYLPGGCHHGTELFVWFFASHLASMSPPTWSIGGIDYSRYNVGSLYLGNGTDFDTTYRLSIADAASLTIPPPSQDPQWRWFFNFLAEERTTELFL